MEYDDLRLIEAGFPCHQVGAETQRERGASSSLPPLYFLHVWWARRPLTPSRAAILASLLPAGTDPEWFLRQLGIEKPVVEINGQQWTLTGKILEEVQAYEGRRTLFVGDKVIKLLDKENERRGKNREIINELRAKDPSLKSDPVLLRWEQESKPIPQPYPKIGTIIPVQMVAADPAHINLRIEFAKSYKVKSILGKEYKWDTADLYGYSRAFLNKPDCLHPSKVILDPTAGGGSIPFEALRLGHTVIANELNPVAAVILHATLQFPIKYGLSLIEDIKSWGNRLLSSVSEKMADLTPFSPLPLSEKEDLRQNCKKCPEIIRQFDVPEYDQIGILYCRQVTCPHCNGEAPLLNTFWLSKEDARQWGVKVLTDGRKQNGKVWFEPYRVHGGRGPNGEDPNLSTVSGGVGTCIHCRQAIDAEEIKRQARGESEHGTWQDRLYCVVAVRVQPKLDKNGKPERFKSGEKKGEIKTEKVRFFRPPNDTDLKALTEAERRLQENWDRWDAEGLIPTEAIPEGHKTREPLRVGFNRWCDMFTPRQLLGHLYLIEELNKLKPQILAELGYEKGRAVATYLQFAIDKGLDYNSRQTRWEFTRGVVKGTFGRHDFSLKWTFGEMIFTGPNSGAAWGLNQIIDAYQGMAELVQGLPENGPKARVVNGTAAYMPTIETNAVDLICMDPPYYNNVQYAELSDYFYVWQKRTLGDLYDCFSRRLTNKTDEAVANPDRDGGDAAAKITYQKMMADIFSECQRVLKSDGIMTLMFTHKSQDAWEALTRSLIENNWIITSSFPVESETQQGIHTKDTASAISSIFLTCRKRMTEAAEPAFWAGFGNTGIQHRIRQAVSEGLEEFAQLKLNAVDEMVASYGRALRVLSEQWPVLDGDQLVSPIRAMSEASRVVAEHHINRITAGRLKVEDLTPEAAMALTLFGIYGLTEFPYDDALNLSKSLNIALESRTGGYVADGRFIGINTEARSGRRARRASAEDEGFHAPLVRKGSKLRLARPEDRNERRMENPQTEWDILQGVILAYRSGDIPVARAYLNRHAGTRMSLVGDLLHVWANEVKDDALQKEVLLILFGLK